MKMDEINKRRRLDSSGSPINVKIEVKEENVMGDEYLMAKGRLQGVLKQLTEQSESESEESDDSKSHHGKKGSENSRKKHETSAPVRSTYLMKLYDRSVDLARFEEDTPLYPICRAWIANNSKKPQTIIKRRLSSPEPESTWTSNIMGDIYRLPPPNGPAISRIPSPTPDQMNKSKEAINLNYDDNPPLPRSQLMKEHLERWNNIKKKWISTSLKNEERYTMSKEALQLIYSKAQESMMTE